MSGAIMEIVMPQLAESVVSATVSKWLNEPGDRIEEYEPICEVITDKVTVELPSTSGRSSRGDQGQGRRNRRGGNSHRR